MRVGRKLSRPWRESWVLKMFKKDIRDGLFLGYSATIENAFMFFGSRFLTRELLGKYFPEYQFSFLKQVHGKHVVEASVSTLREADAHFTSQRNLALVVQSADCVPVLLFGRNSVDKDVVCAIHSGWRSTALNIVSETGTAFSSLIASAIGPHILKNSFEVGLDVSAKLLTGVPAGHQLTSPHEDRMKVYFDLTELIRMQISTTFGVRPLELLEDTKTNSDFASFRRDRERAGRQLSFIVLKS